MDKQERWMLRIPSNSEGEQFLKKMKKYLNKDTYKISKMYTGPRPKGTSQHSTRKENATSVRLYVDTKVTPTSLGTEIIRENARLKMRLDYANRELAKAQSWLDWRRD